MKKFNEFVDNDFLIKNLIEDAENSSLPDLKLISQRESYKNIIKIGKSTIPYLLERDNIIWDNALSEITGEGLNSLEFNTKERMNYWKNWAIKNGY